MNRMSQKIRTAFTLIEMLVVISLIAIISVVALPTILGMFNAGADSQAYNLMAAQLSAARAKALVTAQPVLVHVQLADMVDPKATIYGSCLALTMVYDGGQFRGPIANDSNVIGGDKQQVLVKMPGNMAFGRVSPQFLDAAGQNFSNISDTALRQMTSFNVLFTPQGTVAAQFEGKTLTITNSTIDPNYWAFYTGPDPNIAVWDPNMLNIGINPGSNLGSSVLVLFDYQQAKNRPTGNPTDPTTREYYLTNNCMFLPVNIYTGQLFPRK